jgi:hypothetical protein
MIDIYQKSVMMTINIEIPNIYGYLKQSSRLDNTNSHGHGI